LVWCESMVCNVLIDRVSHRNVASRNPPLKTDPYQKIYFRLPEVVTTGLNISLEFRHPPDKNLDQGRLFERPWKVVDRW
jgi:hypothetical protein